MDGAEVSCRVGSAKARADHTRPQKREVEDKKKNGEKK